MPVIAAAVCPHPPLLVAESGAGAADEMVRLRVACRDAVDRLVRAGAHRLFVIGSGPATRAYDFPTQASFSPWGLPVRVPGGRTATPGSADPAALPLSLLVGAWLVTDHPTPPMNRTMLAIDGRTPPAECVHLGEQLAADGPVALLVMGDGSARRGEKAPGYDDPRAQPFDGTVATALAHADFTALLALDAELAAELLVAGRAPWQVLVGAAAASEGGWRAVLTYAEAPYGVAYFVASWEPA